VCFLFLTLFSVIAASRPVNKNVSTAVVITANPGTEPSVHTLLANYQTGFGYKFCKRLVRNPIQPGR